ncbi:MAG: hypothetical protein SOZ56_03390 [Oscillospiraceae bacterium]|nr:hypothetical protein [Oscillospiraceae bacterium]
MNTNTIPVSAPTLNYTLDSGHAVGVEIYDNFVAVLLAEYMLPEDFRNWLHTLNSNVYQISDRDDVYLISFYLIIPTENGKPRTDKAFYTFSDEDGLNQDLIDFDNIFAVPYTYSGYTSTYDIEYFCKYGTVCDEYECTQSLVFIPVEQTSSNTSEMNKIIADTLTVLQTPNAIHWGIHFDVEVFTHDLICNLSA